MTRFLHSKQLIPCFLTETSDLIGKQRMTTINFKSSLVCIAILRFNNIRSWSRAYINFNKSVNKTD